jgi:ATP synthase protein I
MSEPPGEPPAETDTLARSVARRAERRSFWLAHGERPLAKNLAMIGALGWLIVTPTVGGALLGRWLDGRFNSGITWTGALLVLGLALGCWIGWRRVRDIDQEKDS